MCITTADLFSHIKKPTSAYFFIRIRIWTALYHGKLAAPAHNDNGNQHIGKENNHGDTTGSANTYVRAEGHALRTLQRSGVVYT